MTCLFIDLVYFYQIQPEGIIFNLLIIVICVSYLNACVIYAHVCVGACTWRSEENVKFPVTLLIP